MFKKFLKIDVITFVTLISVYAKSISEVEHDAPIAVSLIPQTSLKYCPQPEINEGTIIQNDGQKTGSIEP